MKDGQQCLVWKNGRQGHVSTPFDLQFSKSGLNKTNTKLITIFYRETFGKTKIMNNLPGIFFFQAEDGIRDRSPSRGLGDVYKRQLGIILIDCFFSCVHCLWIINKIVMYHSNSWNSLWPTKGYSYGKKCLSNTGRISPGF